MSDTITLPAELLAAIKSAAAAEQRSVEEVLFEAVQRYLDDRSWTNLLDYGQEQAKARGIKESDVDRLIAQYRAERSH